MVRFPGALFLRNLLQGRTLLIQLVKRDFKVRFVGSAAGWLWGVIHPLVLLASWTFVFSVCLKMEVPAGEVTRNYPLFLFSGFLPWLLFQDTVQRSASCILENKNLITKTLFPSEVLPVSIFFSSLINHLIALALVVCAVAIWLNHFSFKLFLLPVYMVLLGLLAVGMGWIFGSLQVYLRDTAQVLSVILTFWFWMTPIFINESQVPERLRFLLKANPLSYFVRAYRDRILSSLPPNPVEIAIIAAFGVTAFVCGGLFFRHLKRGFADVL